MTEGIIIKGIGGFYYVRDGEGNVTECKARGKFRSAGLSPAIGDRVTVSRHDSGYVSIEEIAPRKNLLTRPVVSNIDRLMIVLAASSPEPDWLLADKLLIQAYLNRIEPLMVLNKCDEASESVLRQFSADYAPFSRCLVSAATGEGIEELKDRLNAGLTCFAGQSAVGKSSLINRLIPGFDAKTGELSRKTERGRHTTRHAELIPFLDGALLDTPGFSLYDCPDIEQEQLDACYPEFRGYAGNCRFPGCMHITEPDCAVKEMLSQGKMTASRYARYTELSKEIQQRRKHRYD